MRQLILVILCFPTFSLAQSSLPEIKESDRVEILAVMSEQESAWNAGDIESFMNGYWESDSLMFVGKSGITYGYHNTYRRYVQGYPDQRSMGTLTFEILHLTSLGKKSALMIGKWHLKREDGDLGGHFSLTWRKISGQWVIAVDHTS